MTTIVANLEGMAADTAVTSPNGPIYHTDKVFRVGLALLGTAGDAFMCLTFVEWFRSPRRSIHTLHRMIPLESRSDITILELRPGGLYLWNGWGVPERIHNKYYAIGSGSMTAIQELKRGSSLKTAVEAATEWDEFSRCPVQVAMLKPAKKRKR